MYAVKNGRALLIGIVLVTTVFGPLMTAPAAAGGASAEGLDVMPRPAQDYMRFIQVNNFKFDPLAETPEIPAFLSYGEKSLAEVCYLIVQFKRPITPEMKSSLESAGVTILYYINYNAFVVKASGPALEQAKGLQSVRWVGAFEPAYKLSPRLSERYDEMVKNALEKMQGVEDSKGVGVRLSRDAAGLKEVRMESEVQTSPSLSRSYNQIGATSGTTADRTETSHSLAETLRTAGSHITVDILTFEKSRIPDVLKAVDSLGGTGIKYSLYMGGVIRAEIDRGVVAELAHQVGIMWIDRFVQPRVFNDVARWVIQSGDAMAYATPVHDHGIWGTGQTITIGDSGLDYEHDSFEDPSYPLPGSGHRKVTDYYIPPNATGDSRDNGINHGTHTSGTVAGDDGAWHVYDGSPAGLHGTEGPHDGEAFDAKVQMQDLSTDGEWIYSPPDMHDMWQSAVDRDSWIHSNSWGTEFGDYIHGAAQTDDFIWNNQEFIVVFAAGNSEAYPGIINPYSVAKNCISVGATKNGKDMDNVAWFSSRGPAADGRIKPDVMAPGVDVWSAKGNDPGPNLDTYVQLSGTSMATPMVAASAALTRQYFMDGWYPTGTREIANAFTPSAALVKAILINSAVEVSGNGAYWLDEYRYPNNNQGWGRILLDNALYFQGDLGGLVVHDERAGIDTGATVTYQLAIGDVGMPVEITLVWSDHPGVPYENPNLVNDLDLVVTAPDGTYYYGNTYQGYDPGESIPNPGGSTDRLNNVESVLVITDVQAGLWTIEVIGYNVPMGPQPYALVMTGAVVTQKGIVQLDHSGYQSSATVNIRVADTDLNLNPAVPDVASVSMSSTTESDPEVITLTETGDSTCVFVGSVLLEKNAIPVPGDDVLQVQNMDTITAAYYDEDDGLGGAGWNYHTAVVDDDPPSISSVDVINIRFNRATVVWTTDESSDSVVFYGKTTSPSGIESDSHRITSHSIPLLMLDENATYYFAVQSRDEVGNTAYDNNSTTYYWFKTTVRPPTAPPDIEWPTFHNNQPRQGVSPSTLAPPLDLEWSDNPPYVAEMWTSPVLKEGVLYTTTLDGFLRARDPYSGEILWARGLGGASYYTGTPVVENGLVYATFHGDAGGSLYALDSETGETIWVQGPSSGLDFNARIAMAYADGLVFGSTWGGQIFALDAADGSIEWTYSAPGLPWGGPTVNESMLYMGCDDLMLAVDEFSGTLIWSTALDEKCTAPPLSAQGNVYEGTIAGTMYALDATTGDVVWTAGGFGLIDYSTPAYDGSAIYFGAYGPDTEPQGIYVSLDATTGSILWQRGLTGAPVESSVAYANGYLYGTARNAPLMVISSSDGTILQTIPLSSSGSTCSPAVADGWVYVEDIDGNVYGFSGLVPVGCAISPTRQLRDAVPDSTVDYYVNVTNVGISGPDTFDVEVALGALGWTTELYESDGVTPLGDSDSDSVPDTGSLPTGSTSTTIVRMTIPPTAIADDKETAVIKFASNNDQDINRTARVTSFVPPPRVEISPRQYFPLNPGDSATATMQVRNAGAFSDTVDITAWSDNGWLTGIFKEDGATPLDDTDADGTPDMGLLPGLTSLTIVAQIDVPIDAEMGTVDGTYVHGVSSNDLNANDTNVVVVELALPPDKEWPTFHNSNDRRGMSPAVFQPPLDTVWTTPPYSYCEWTGPVMKDGIVYSTTLDGYIRAHDAWTGELIWANLVGGMYQPMSTPAVENGVVYATFATGYMEGYVCAFDAYTGANLWTVGPEAGINFQARIQMVVDDGLLFGSAFSGEVFALNASTGELVWCYNLFEEVGEVPSWGETVAGGMLFIGTMWGGKMYAFDEQTGALIWTLQLDGPIWSAPSVVRGTVYVGTMKGTMYALDMASGGILWSYKELGAFETSTPATDCEKLYFGTWKGTYYALNAIDGSLIWQTRSPDGQPISSSPAYANGYVYATSGGGYLYVLDAATGEIVQSLYLDSSESTSGPAISEGWVWLQDYDGRLHAFKGQLPIEVLVTPSSQTKEVTPSSIVDFVVTVENIGYSDADTFDVAVTPGALGWTMELYESDRVTPLGDSDSDGVPDTGSIPSYASVDIVVRVTVPSTVVVGDLETAQVTFTSNNDPAVFRTASVTSFVPPPGVSLGPRQYFQLNPGDNATARMEVRNTGGFPDKIDIATSSKIGWFVTLLQGDGATQLNDTDFDGMPDTGLLPGLGSTEIVVVVRVPYEAEYGMVELTNVIGVSSLDPSESSSGRIIIELVGEPSIEWPTFHQNYARTGVSPVPYELPLSSYSVWNYSSSTSFSPQGPIINDGNVYFTDWSGSICSLKSSTGQLNWRQVLGDKGYQPGPPTAAYGSIYVAFAKNYGNTVKLYCLDEDTGSVQWSYSSVGGNNTYARTSPVAVAGMVFWSDYAGGMIYANDAFTGSPIWSKRMPGIDWATEGPTYWGGMLFCVGTHPVRIDMGDVIALDAFTGEEVWSKYFSTSFESAPAILDEKLLMVGKEGMLYALDPVTGEQIWMKSDLGIEVLTTPAYGDGLIFVPACYFSEAGRGMLWALNADTGSVRWYRSTYGSFRSSAVYVNGVVIAADDRGCLYVWDAWTGTLLQQIEIGYSVSSKDVAIGDGMLVVGHSWGTVSAYSFAGALEISSVEIAPAARDISVATAAVFEAHACDIYGNPISDVNFTWSSVGGLGTVTPLTDSGELAEYVAGEIVGVDTLRAVADGHMANATVNIIAGAADHVVVSPTIAEVAAGESLQFSATAVDKFGNEVPGATFTWQVIGSVGTVSSDGLFTAGTAPGAGIVIAISAIGSGVAMVEVVPGPLAELVATPNPLTIDCGDTMLLEAQGYDGYGNGIPGLSYDWTNDIGTLMVVSLEKGTALFTAPKVPGSGELTVTAGGMTTIVPATVEPGPLHSIAVTPDPVELAAGSTITVHATPMDIYGNEITGLTVVWTASSALGSISQSGVLTASEIVGSGTVTASIGSVSKSVMAKVVPGPMASLTLNPSPLATPAGSVITLTAEARDEYGNLIEDVSVTWAATSGTILALSAEGTAALYLVPTLAGSATITATAESISEVVSVTVTPAAIDHLVVSPTAISVESGGGASLTVSAFDVYGNEISVSLFSWSTTIGEVIPSADGRTADFYAEGSGSGTINVTAGGKSASVAVAVSEGPQTLGDIMSEPASLALTATSIILALVALLLFMKVRQLSRKLEEIEEGAERPQAPEGETPPGG